MKAFYARTRALSVLPAAVLVPAIAILGIYQAGRTGHRQQRGPAMRAENLSEHQVGTKAEQATLETIVRDSLIGYFALIGIALLARGARVLHERRGGMIALSYGNGRTVRGAEGPQRARSQPAQQRAACQRLRAGAPAARPAASA